MKKLFLILSVIFAVSCSNTSNSYPALSEGEIIQIEKYNDYVVIHVVFAGAGNYRCIFKFIGSDTCKVGQKVTLQ